MNGNRLKPVGPSGIPPSNSSRTILIVLGVFGVLIALCCGGCGLLGYFGFQRGKVDDAAAKAFVRPALEKFGKDWRPETFRPFASSSWNDSVPADKEKELFAKYAKTLGPLKKLGEPTSQSFYYGSQSGLPSATRVTMSMPATFAKADGTIRVTAAKIDDRWGIERLEVHSDAFLK